jgi:hypothetical protein
MLRANKEIREMLWPFDFQVVDSKEFAISVLGADVIVREMTVIRQSPAQANSEELELAARNEVGSDLEDVVSDRDISRALFFPFVLARPSCSCVKAPPDYGHVHRRFAPTALMLGNFANGTAVLAPAGMLSELSAGLDVTIRDAGLLITFGAVVLCIGSPLTAWLTSRIERRTLLTATLVVIALANVVSAFAPDYASLLVIRLIMLAVSALYTPQAAGTAALIVPAE